MKKLVMLLLTIVLLSAACAVAEEIPVTKAGGYADPALLAKQAVVAMNSATGEWSARTYQADAALDWFWEDGSRSDGPVLMIAELQGSVETGLVTPVMQVYHMMEAEEHPVHAVSILIDGVRYDFAVTSSFVKVNGKLAEVLSAPLDGESMMIIDMLASCEEASVRLIGDGIVTTKINAKNTVTRARIEHAGLSSMRQAKELMQSAGMDRYDLWDLNASAWETVHGVRPVYQTNTVSKTIGDVETTDAFGMVRAGTAGNVAAAVQKLLRDAGFMAGGDEKNVNARVTAAVCRAQQHYGMLSTGLMDGVLAGLLSGGSVTEADAGAEEAGVRLGGAVEITLDRYWTADAVKAQRAQEADRIVSNSDRVLLVADGRMVNLSDKSIRLMIDAKAVLVMNGQVRYDAVIVCECDGGARLDTQMLAREAARIIVYAELPQQVLSADADWTLEVTAGGETAVFTLK